jgi:DNA-binding response OmpR family regulator
VKKLLIAEDESGIRRLIRLTLESEDYEIIEASDGEQALTMARAELPELVLLDVMMPRRTGLEVCRLLKADDTTASMTIVMLTARAQDSDLREARAAGCDDYFMKPFSPVALLRKVDEIFAARSRARGS